MKSFHLLSALCVLNLSAAVLARADSELGVFAPTGPSAKKPATTPAPKVTKPPKPKAKPKTSKGPSEITTCSFNIQFLGAFANRDNQALAELMRDEKCDVLVIQELIAAPSVEYLRMNQLFSFPEIPGHGMTYPAGPNGFAEPIIPVEKVTKFFDAMAAAGFKNFMMSEEKTGAKSHNDNGTGSEWFVAFYNADKVEVAKDLPHGFISPVRVGPKSWERTPYAFPFRVKGGNLDFVLISVHLAPNGPAWKRRAEEIAGIRAWIEEVKGAEKDFITLGDTNIEDKEELTQVLQGSWISLNDECRPTNTNPKPGSMKPYDQVMFDPIFTSEAEVPREIVENGQKRPNFEVIPLRQKMAARWAKVHPGEAYPGQDMPGYVHDKFRTEYSDHQPVKFKMLVPKSDDDSSKAER